MIVIVMFLTLAGNSTLILAILCHRKERRKRVNIFLVNLACGDLGKDMHSFRKSAHKKGQAGLWTASWGDSLS